MTTQTQSERRSEALQRAEQGESALNYDAIFEGFIAKGIEKDDILPRENVFTFDAWLAKGRCVSKGQKGVKIETFIPAKRDKEDGTESRFMVRKYVTVFHISQTEEIRKNG